MQRCLEFLTFGTFLLIKLALNVVIPSSLISFSAFFIALIVIISNWDILVFKSQTSKVYPLWYERKKPQP